MSTEAQTESNTRLHGPWLTAARLGWSLVFLLAVGLYIASFFDDLRQPLPAAHRPAPSATHSP